jgi:hypothetical protein
MLLISTHFYTRNCIGRDYCCTSGGSKEREKKEEEKREREREREREGKKQGREKRMRMMINGREKQCIVIGWPPPPVVAAAWLIASTKSREVHEFSGVD